MTPLRDLSPAELRLELAEAEAARASTWKGGFAKRDRIAAITARLVKLGSF
jgi:hypothetical protein